MIILIMSPGNGWIARVLGLFEKYVSRKLAHHHHRKNGGGSGNNNFVPCRLDDNILNEPYRLDGEFPEDALLLQTCRPR